MKIYVRDGQFFADGFAVRRAFSLSEGEERYLSYVAEGGCGCTTITLRDGILRSDGGGIEVILRGEDAEIRPLPYPTIPTVRRLNITKGEELYRIECRAAARSSILITGSAEEEWHTRTMLLSPAIRQIDGQRDAIVEVTADCPEGRYLLLFSLTKGNARILLEECGESVICRGNEVTVRRTLSDLRRREITSHYTWKGEGFICSREVLCGREVMVGRENIGRLLLESAIAEDLPAMRDLLSPENEAETVLAYFGEIIAVDPLPPDPPTAVTVIAKREGQKRYVTYDFDVDGRGRIENIRTLGE